MVTEIQFDPSDLRYLDPKNNLEDEDNVENIDKSMEIIDKIDESQHRAAKTVKFQENISQSSNRKYSKNLKSNAKNPKEFKNNTTNSAKSRRENIKRRRSISRENNFGNVLRSRKIQKKFEIDDLSQRSNYQTISYSRPSSVTSMFTACSNGKDLGAYKVGRTRNAKNIVKVEDLSDSEFEENTKRQSQTNKYKRQKAPKLRQRRDAVRISSRGIDMSLVSEIKSEFEQSMDFSYQ